MVEKLTIIETVDWLLCSQDYEINSYLYELENLLCTKQNGKGHVHNRPALFVRGLQQDLLGGKQSMKRISAWSGQSPGYMWNIPFQQRRRTATPELNRIYWWAHWPLLFADLEYGKENTWWGYVWPLALTLGACHTPEYQGYFFKSIHWAWG